MKLPPFELERWFIEHEPGAPVDACASDVEAPSMSEVLALASPDLRAEWETLTLSYTEAHGHPRLRAAIAALYDGLEPEDVVVFTGAGDSFSSGMDLEECFLEPYEDPQLFYRRSRQLALVAGAPAGRMLIT